MRTVEVSKNGVDLGSVSFRGIVAAGGTAVAALPDDTTEKRLYKCSPVKCVPKDVARRIADHLSDGVDAGQEEGYEWHS